MLCYLAKAGSTHGFKEAALSFLYKKTSNRGAEKHEVLRILNILKTLDIKPKEIPLKLFFSEQENKKIVELIKQSLSNGEKPLIGIAPGSVWATKRWTVSGFKRLVLLLEEQGFNVFLIGGPSDKEKCEEIRSNKSVNLAGKLSLSESTCLISKLDCIVTNDSSPLHIAGAVNTPTVAIYCATAPEFGYTPWMVDNEIVEVKDLDCRPCGRHGGNTCPTRTNFCQNKISSEEVYDACLAILAKNSKMSNESIN